MLMKEKSRSASWLLRFKRLFCLVFAGLTLAAVTAEADTSGLFLPTRPSGPGGQDQIESTTGARCSQSMNSSGSYLDVGMASSTAASGSIFSRRDSSLQRDDRVSVIGYVRLIVPLGKQPKRLDCARLYEMELLRLRAELELMRMGAE